MGKAKKTAKQLKAMERRVAKEKRDIKKGMKKELDIAQALAEKTETIAKEKVAKGAQKEERSKVKASDANKNLEEKKVQLQTKEKLESEEEKTEAKNAKETKDADRIEEIAAQAAKEKAKAAKLAKKNEITRLAAEVIAAKTLANAQSKLWENNKFLQRRT